MRRLEILDLTNVKVPIDYANGLPKPGCVKPIKFAGLPVLLLRNGHNEIIGFENVFHFSDMNLLDEAQQLRGSVT